MKLSDAYGIDRVYKQSNGTYYNNTYCATSGGEYYVHEGHLCFRAPGCDPQVIEYDVGEWLVINNRVLCMSMFCGREHFRGFDANGKFVCSGIVTESKALLYAEEGFVIREEPATGKKEQVHKIQGNRGSVDFIDNGFCLTRGYPYSDFLYNVFYDENGKMLEDRNREIFAWSLLRDLDYRLLSRSKYRKAMNSGALFEEFDDESKRVEILHNSSPVTYEVIDELIRLREKMGVENRLSVSAYRKVQKLFYKVGIEDNLEVPLINVMFMNSSGRYGAVSYRFSSNRIIDALKKICKDMGAAEFKRLLYNAAGLNRAMQEKF